jgi:hypothetical protein
MHAVPQSTLDTRRKDWNGNEYSGADTIADEAKVRTPGSGADWSTV